MPRLTKQVRAARLKRARIFNTPAYRRTTEEQQFLEQYTETLSGDLDGMTPGGESNQRGR